MSKCICQVKSENILLVTKGLQTQMHTLDILSQFLYYSNTISK